MEFKYEEKFVSSKRMYTGNIIGVELTTVVLPDGREASRDVVVHPGASVVVPMTTDGEVYLVRQYRTPIGLSTLELPAGKLDKNEEPLECATRELFEETGLIAGKTKHLTSIFTTPGFCNEVIHMFLATDLKKGESHTDEDEFLTVEVFHISKLIELIIKQEITDAKTIIGILLAEKAFKGEL